MARRTVAVVLVVDVPDSLDDGNAVAAEHVARLVQAAGYRVPYVEAHDDLDAVLDEDTAARYRIGD